MSKNIKSQPVQEEGLKNFDWNGLENPKQAIKRRSIQYRDIESVPDAFRKEYPQTPACENSENRTMDEYELFPGKYVYVNVDDITANGLRLSSDKIKHTIENTDNFRPYPGFSSYLLQNGNKVIGRVREMNADKVVIDVLDAYYKLWRFEVMNTNIAKEVPMTVSDLELTKGGYLGRVSIPHLKELTGEEWHNTCFIPGSQIVLNVENDFNRWEGATVKVIPQKFTSFNSPTRRNDNCLVCSRKRLLSYEGARFLEELYNRIRLVEKSGKPYESPRFTGKVTGVISTNRSRGAFVEIEEHGVTGLLPLETYELVNYPTGATVEVRIDRIEPVKDTVFSKNKNGHIQWPNVKVFFKE